MKPSKVVRLIASVLGMLLLIDANIIGINFFFFDSDDQMSFLEYCSAVITVLTGIVLLCTIVILTIDLFETLLKKADKEWEETQKKK